ncbi:P44/Msp2 family outer membrane protein [Anaplasma platys]|uniref:P44/Msp2 family outer membrane protein n=1 Tax=Anaplasma platys TaxID=949 RepID=UPI0039777381
MGESSGSTAAVYPYARDGAIIERRSDKFDWGMPNPSILFKDSHLIALEASIGYSIGSARVELEI